MAPFWRWASSLWFRVWGDWWDCWFWHFLYGWCRDCWDRERGGWLSRWESCQRFTVRKCWLSKKLKGLCGLGGWFRDWRSFCFCRVGVLRIACAGGIAEMAFSNSLVLVPAKNRVCRDCSNIEACSSWFCRSLQVPQCPTRSKNCFCVYPACRCTGLPSGSGTFPAKMVSIGSRSSLFSAVSQTTSSSQSAILYSAKFRPQSVDDELYTESTWFAFFIHLGHSWLPIRKCAFSACARRRGFGWAAG